MTLRDAARLPRVDVEWFPEDLEFALMRSRCAREGDLPAATAGESLGYGEPSPKESER